MVSASGINLSRLLASLLAFALAGLLVALSGDAAAAKRCGTKPADASLAKRDKDRDGIPNWRDRDVDGDHRFNSRDRDVDGDGIPNRRDRDVDGDGIRNASDPDIDGDCVFNTREQDADGDRIQDTYDDDPYSTGRPLGARVANAARFRSAGPTNPFFGLVSNEALAAYTPSAMDAEMAGVKAAGVGTLRGKLDWSAIERAPGVYDFRWWDRFVLGAARNGIQVLPILYGTPAFYPAAGGPAGPPLDPGTLARFAHAATERYGPGGTLWAQNPGVAPQPVRSWQIWNEPNYQAFWPTGPNAGAYAAMLKVVSPAIRAADPGAEIVAAGLPESYSNEPAAQYLRELYDAGARGSFDTVAVHAYARSAEQADEVLRSIRAVMNARGDAAKPIWVTEFGYASAGPSSRYTVDEANQARLIQRTIRALAESRASLGLKGLIYYAWKDALPWQGGKDFWGLHTGLLRIDGSPKPAFAAFGDTARALS